MKACVLHAIKDIRYEEVQNPAVKSGEVLVKIGACGICSSDLDRVFRTGAYHFPVVLGHEMAGQVISAAPDVDQSFIGKYVVVYPLLPCFECESCQKGFYAQCKSYNYFGSRCDGGYAQYLSVPVWNIKPFAETVPFTHAALCEPAAVAWNAVSKAGVKNNNKVLIVGTGLIGIVAGLWARKKGADVAFKARNIQKAEFIKALGFDKVQNDFEEGSFDICMECVGTNNSIADSLKYVKARGTVVFVGNPQSDVVLDKKIYWKILRQELVIKGVWNSSYPSDWEAVLENIGSLPCDKLITHKFKLSDGMDAFNILNEAAFKIKGMYVIE
ncbi:MAG: galactitol-1-phosphate 5-dehydrogenase [Spirochaetia bacterium]|nr:galactitol-1-phosphate 5-dehydrogenase [Spirochaetia bacterium]MBR5017710.1 galactitol-1-phosphate 5-dehydrogenase [Spirochaetia bacterium]